MDNSNLERLEVHSPYFYGFTMSRYNTNLMYLDVSGTAITKLLQKNGYLGRALNLFP